MESFYGGPQGASLVIKAVYYTYEELVSDFQLNTCKVEVGEYAIINPVYGENTEISQEGQSWDRFGVYAGNIYRREIDGSASFAGNIMGPQGPATAWTMSGIGAGLTSAQYQSSTLTDVTIELPYNGSGDTTETVTVSVSPQNISDTISSLNTNITAEILLRHPMYVGLPFYIYCTTFNENFPNIYFIYDWNNTEWVYGGKFYNINRENIVGVVSNTDEAADLTETLVNGGLMFYTTETSTNSIVDVRNANYTYTG